MIKPSSRVSQGFAASWFTPLEGPPRRPLASYEARKGAAQELSKLMVELHRAWSSPLISQYKDEYGRPHGTINLEVACNAPPDSDLRVIAQAYMGSSESGYSIVYWSSTSEVVWHSDSLMQFGDFSICKTDQSWKITYPGLPAAASGDVLAICSKSPEKWNYECWLSRSSIFRYCGIVFDPVGVNGAILLLHLVNESALVSCNIASCLGLVLRIGKPPSLSFFRIGPRRPTGTSSTLREHVG
jgi:hypothetical protein